MIEAKELADMAEFLHGLALGRGGDLNDTARKRCNELAMYLVDEANATRNTPDGAA